MYGQGTGVLSVATTAGTGTFANALAAAGNRLWVPFAVVALFFASISLKELLTRPRAHRP